MPPIPCNKTTTGTFLSGALAGKFNVPQIVIVLFGFFPVKKSLMVIVGIEGNSIFVPFPFHSLGLGRPFSDNTVVGIARLNANKKTVAKIKIRAFIILLEIIYQHLNYSANHFLIQQ